MSLPKLQQVPGLHPQSVPQPDVALHARPATSTVTGKLSGWSLEVGGAVKICREMLGQDLVQLGFGEGRT